MTIKFKLIKVIVENLEKLVHKVVQEKRELKELQGKLKIKYKLLKMKKNKLCKIVDMQDEMEQQV